MSRTLAASLLLALALGTAPPARAADPAVRWREWDPGLAEAQKNGRPVLVDFYTQWCGWCRRMDKDVYSRADVRDYLQKKFVTVKIDAEASDAARYEGKALTSRSLAARFRVTGYPTTVFLRADGGHLANVPGYIPADRFMLLLRYVGDGHLDRGESFEEFSRRAAKP
jgi:thioredoxin-related protein